MSLYASKKVIESTINLFTELHECSNCSRYFTHMESVGCWDCRYHPGEFDYTTMQYTCCGEKMRDVPYQHSTYSHLMTWKGKDRYDYIPALSAGCCRRDCLPKEKSLIPNEDISVDDIATLIPYMERNLQERPGLKKNPLRLVRNEERPLALWAQPPRK